MRRTLGLLAVAAPFVAAAIAAASARRDFRLGAMAIVATLAVWLAVRFGRRSFATALNAFGLGTLGATLAAVVVGARSVIGVGSVAVVVAAFATAGQLLLRPAGAATSSEQSSERRR
jgi:hypothetical protein